MDPIKSNNQLQSLLHSIIKSHGEEKLIFLLQCFQKWIPPKSNDDAYKGNKQSIEKALQFTIQQFHSQVTLQQAASTDCMSIASFCHYFKYYTSKTYIDYLNEVRIEYACRQLRETNKSVLQIGYESGYNTIPHFHRQFLKLKKLTPLQYRKNLTPATATIKLQIPAQAI
jgi:AraC-like DNA-binding protein